MRAPILLIALLVAASGCSKRAEHTVLPSTVVLPPRLDSYFEQYCDYTGGLGIGFDASHTYDYRFRQHLKETHDPELKRLFVFQHLNRDVEFALGDFEKGIIGTGKTSSRPLTLSEWQDTQKKIQAQIDDLATYYAFTNFATTNRNPFDPPDPKLDSMWIEELRGKLQSVTNSPAANQALQTTAASLEVIALSGEMAKVPSGSAASSELVRLGQYAGVITIQGRGAGCVE